MKRGSIILGIAVVAGILLLVLRTKKALGAEPKLKGPSPPLPGVTPRPDYLQPSPEDEAGDVTPLNPDEVLEQDTEPRIYSDANRETSGADPASAYPKGAGRGGMNRGKGTIHKLPGVLKRGGRVALKGFRGAGKKIFGKTVGKVAGKLGLHIGSRAAVAIPVVGGIATGALIAIGRIRARGRNKRAAAERQQVYADESIQLFRRVDAGEITINEAIPAMIELRDTGVEECLAFHTREGNRCAVALGDIINGEITLLQTRGPTPGSPASIALGWTPAPAGPPPPPAAASGEPLLTRESARARFGRFEV